MSENPEDTETDKDLEVLLQQFHEQIKREPVSDEMRALALKLEKAIAKRASLKSSDT